MAPRLDASAAPTGSTQGEKKASAKKRPAPKKEPSAKKAPAPKKQPTQAPTTKEAQDEKAQKVQSALSFTGTFEKLECVVDDEETEHQKQCCETIELSDASQSPSPPAAQPTAPSAPTPPSAQTTPRPVSSSAPCTPLSAGYSSGPSSGTVAAAAASCESMAPGLDEFDLPSSTDDSLQDLDAEVASRLPKGITITDAAGQASDSAAHDSFVTELPKQIKRQTPATESAIDSKTARDLEMFEHAMLHGCDPREAAGVRFSRTAKLNSAEYKSLGREGRKAVR